MSASAEKMVRLTWPRVRQLCETKFGHLTGCPYGVPRGGSVVAAMLHPCPADRPEHADYIVDDILDSGRTAAVWQQRFPDKPFVVLVDKQTDPWATGHWIHFPWESPPEQDGQDILLRFVQFVQSHPQGLDLATTVQRHPVWQALFT